MTVTINLALDAAWTGYNLHLAFKCAKERIYIKAEIGYHKFWIFIYLLMAGWGMSSVIEDIFYIRNH